MQTPRETSPYNLLQEQLRDEPWKLLVACIMLNQTSAVQVKKVIWKFFERWPDPESVLCTEISVGGKAILEMKEMLKPLGFQNRRFTRIFGMSYDYLINSPQNNIEEIDRLHGVGKYAADSFRIFVGGHIVEDVLDKELKNYVNWAKTNYAR